MDRILCVWEHDLLFQHGSPYLVAPDGQAAVEPELAEVRRSVELERSSGPLLTAQPDDGTVRQAQLLGELRQQHHASERRWQCGHQEAVIAARRNARDGASSISTQAIRDQPFTREEHFGLGSAYF